MGHHHVGPFRCRLSHANSQIIPRNRRRVRLQRHHQIPQRVAPVVGAVFYRFLSVQIPWIEVVGAEGGDEFRATRIDAQRVVIQSPADGFDARSDRLATGADAVSGLPQ